MKILDYERCVYSQNGEDGIVDVLAKKIIDPNKRFLEIGWGNGSCNNTRYLVEQGWSGVGVDAAYEPRADLTFPPDFVFRRLMVMPDNLEPVFQGTPLDVDFFSLDIDSFDYDISRWILSQGYRPKIACLEINPRFGNQVQASFPFRVRPKKKIYRKTSIYGASIAKYLALWEHYGYRYFGYDSTVTNVFFYDPRSVSDPDVPYHTLEEFPIKQDGMEAMIDANGFWAPLKSEIYRLAKEDL